MNIELHYRTYSIFGGNATLNVASKWLSSQLLNSYGGSIDSVLIEFCAGNVSPPKKTLEANHDRFEQFLKGLPIAELKNKKTELRICSKLIKHYHDEIDRDSQVLSLKVFKNALSKCAQLLESAPNILKDLNGFNNEAMASDIREAIKISPNTLQELAELYLEQQKT